MSIKRFQNCAISSSKRSLPCCLFPVISSTTIHFSPRYRSVHCLFVLFRFILFVRLHNVARTCTNVVQTRWPFNERELHPHWKRFCEASVRCQEAARAYKRGCEAAGSPVNGFFLMNKSAVGLHTILRMILCAIFCATLCGV